MLFSHPHVHVGLCRDITGNHVVWAGQAPSMSSFSTLQSSHVVRKTNRTTAGLTETQHVWTAVRSLAKSSNISCNILYHLRISNDRPDIQLMRPMQADSYYTYETETDVMNYTLHDGITC